LKYHDPPFDKRAFPDLRVYGHHIPNRPERLPEARSSDWYVTSGGRLKESRPQY